MFQQGNPPFPLADISEVAHQDVTLTTDCFQIGHGKSTFLKGDRVQKMQREAAGSATTGGLGPCLLDDGVKNENIPFLIWNVSCTSWCLQLWSCAYITGGMYLQEPKDFCCSKATWVPNPIGVRGGHFMSLNTMESLSLSSVLAKHGFQQDWKVQRSKLCWTFTYHVWIQNIWTI